MPKIIVKEPFTLRLDDGRVLPFCVGLHECEDDVATHWYTLQHADLTDAKLAKKVAKEQEPRDTSQDLNLGHVVENINEVKIDGVTDAQIVSGEVAPEQAIPAGLQQAELPQG